MTNSKLFRDTPQTRSPYLRPMRSRIYNTHSQRMYSYCLFLALAWAFCCSAGLAQSAPLLSGGVGFLTQTNGGNTIYIPTIAPVLELPLGDHLLIESKANLIESAFPRPGKGYDTSHYVALAYLQGDLQVSPHATLTAGYFYTPFNTFNERLSPIWINNFVDGPLISGIGIASPSGSGLGVMLRGNAYQNHAVSITYDAYFSGRSGREQFPSTRAAGDRISFFFPRTGIEVGTSFNRTLQGIHTNNTGLHLWWTPPDSRLRFRSEYAHTTHAQGYWFELASQLTSSGSSVKFTSRLEPVFRFQQTFRSALDASDGLPSVNTQRADFGLDLRLPHEVRLNTSYSRRFASTGNTNIWQTGIVYRFLTPAWRSR